MRARLSAEEARLAGPLSVRWDTAAPGERPAVVQALKDGLATRAYLRTVIGDLAEALGEESSEGEDRRAAHHRH